MTKKYWIYKEKKIPVKKPYYPKTEKDNEKLYRELVRKVGQANKRLNKIRKEFGGDIGWAGSILKKRAEFNLVDTWRGKGIKVNKSMSKERMQATISAINKFINSQTSTVKGIRKVMNKQQKLLRQKFSSPNKELTVEESKTLYSLYDDPDFKNLTENIGGSAEDIFSLLVEAKEDYWSEDKFIRELRMIMNKTPDENMKKKISAIFNKWM